MKRVWTLYKQAYAGLGRDIWFLAFVGFVNRAGTMVLPFLALYFTAKVGYSPAKAATFLLIYGFGSLTGSYTGGQLCSYLGPFRVLMGSLILGGVSYLLFPLFVHEYALMAGCFAMGFLADAFRPAILACFAEHASAGTQARAFALLRLAMNMGISVGPAIGGFLATRNYDLIFLVEGGTCVLAGLLVPLLFKSQLGVTVAQRREAEAKQTGVKTSPLKDPAFMGLMLLVLGLCLGLFQFMGAYPLYLNEHYGFSEDRIGLLFGVNGLILALFEMVVVHKLETRNLLPLFGLGTFLCCGSFALLPFGGSFSFVLGCLVILTLGEMISFPFSTVLVAIRAGTNSGPYMGVYSSVFSLAMMVAPPVGLYCLNYWGPNALWFSVGGIGLLVWLGSLILSRHFKKTTTVGIETVDQPVKS